MSENNKLIAEFLGWEQFGSIGMYDTTFHNDKGSLHWLTKDMRFHNDWNWLMILVNKIESLNYFVSIKKNWCKITHNNGETFSLRWEQDSTKIGATYNSCVEFIKWYNENN